MSDSKLWPNLATLGPIGYLPAPGTVATFVTLPFVFWLRMMVPDQTVSGWIIVGIFIASLGIVHYALPHFKRFEDPSEIVLDEVLGCIITFWAIPLNAQTVMVGFVLFRFLDIAKIIGIKYVERLPGSWGIMMDDIVAAGLVNIILRLTF